MKKLMIIAAATLCAGAAFANGEAVEEIQPEAAIEEETKDASTVLT